MFQLEKKLISAKNRLSFLVDYASFSPAEMRLNSNTFMWHGRMGAIFEEHRLIIAEKKVQYEEALKVNTSCFRPRYFSQQSGLFESHCPRDCCCRHCRRKTHPADSKSPN